MEYQVAKKIDRANKKMGGSLSQEFILLEFLVGPCFGGVPLFGVSQMTPRHFSSEPYTNRYFH